MSDLGGLRAMYEDLKDPYRFFEDMTEADFISWLYLDEYGEHMNIPYHVPELFEILESIEHYEFAAILRDIYKENNFI